MKKYFLLVFLQAAILLTGRPAVAAEPSFTVDSLTANYYLDRDAKGVSTLAAEEVFGIQFPSSGASFTGFTRTIPTKYQKNTNDLKITGVTDAGGSAIPYSTSYDGDKNLVVTIGNPSITVFGSQTYFLRYQAKGAINFLSDHQEFYPNFNGRGWDVPFGSITGIVHMPDSLAAQLQSTPQCLIDVGQCKVQQEKKDGNTIYTVRSLNGLAAKQSLTAKFKFKQGTFNALRQNTWNKWLVIAGSIIAFLVILALIRETARKIKSKRPSKKKP